MRKWMLVGFLALMLTACDDDGDPRLNKALDNYEAGLDKFIATLEDTDTNNPMALAGRFAEAQKPLMEASKQFATLMAEGVEPSEAQKERYEELKQKSEKMLADFQAKMMGGN